MGWSNLILAQLGFRIQVRAEWGNMSSAMCIFLTWLPERRPTGMPTVRTKILAKLNNIQSRPDSPYLRQAIFTPNNLINIIQSEGDIVQISTPQQLVLMIICIACQLTKLSSPLHILSVCFKDPIRFFYLKGKNLELSKTEPYSSLSTSYISLPRAQNV